MDGLLVVIILSFVIIGGLILVSNLFDFSGQKKSVTAEPETAAPDPEPEYHEITRWRSVKISPGTRCCDYAGILSGKVFLLSEAPPLPLVNCAETNCSCRYIYLDDRRSGSDRRTGPIDPGYDLSTTPSDRRRRSGRRAADLVT